MKKIFGLAALALLASCQRESPSADLVPADSVLVAPVTDSTATAPGVEASPSGDTVMARDTARLM